MTIFDLLLILAFLACMLALLYLLFSLMRRQWMQARRILLVLGSFLMLYALVLIGTSLLSPQRVLAMHQDRCFDDWCISVERVTQQSTIGTASHIMTTRGQFYLVTVRVSSRARGSSQRARDAQVYLLDARNQRYDPSTRGQLALDALGQGGQPLDSELVPGSSFTRTIVFDLPNGSSHLALVVTHGLFPDVLVIGSEQSFLHKPTIFQLQIE